MIDGYDHPSRMQWCRMLEIEELSFFERLITQSAGDEALLLELYIRSEPYELQWQYAHWYNE